MRKIFGGAMLFSALGAVVLGGALAWNNTESTFGSNFVGDVDFVLVPTFQTGNLLSPNGGPEVEVVHAAVTNTGSYSLYYQGSTVVIYDVNSLEGTCLEGYFLGGGKVSGGSNLFTNPEVPSGDTEGWVIGTIATLENAPEACQGAEVFWAFHVTMGTAPLAP